MDMAEYLKGIDAQIKAEAEREAKRHGTKGERRQHQVPVAVERRTQPDRRRSNRDISK